MYIHTHTYPVLATLPHSLLLWTIPRFRRSQSFNEALSSTVINPSSMTLIVYIIGVVGEPMGEMGWVWKWMVFNGLIVVDIWLMMIHGLLNGFP